MVGAILFIVANAYYPARLIAKKFRPWPKEVAVFFRKYLKAHISLNLVASGGDVTWTLCRGEEYLSGVVLSRYDILDRRRAPNALSGDPGDAKKTSDAPYSADTLRGLDPVDCDWALVFIMKIND